MIAPPGMPKTSVTPSFSSVARIAPDPVSMSGAPVPERAGLAAGGAVVIVVPCVRRTVNEELPRDRALRSGVHELGVLRENATGIARWKRHPAGTPVLQLGRIDK